MFACGWADGFTGVVIVSYLGCLCWLFCGSWLLWFALDAVIVLADSLWLFAVWL